MELEGTENFKKVESLIKTHFNIPKDNHFPYAFDKGMDLNKHSFENSFEHFQEEAKSPSTQLMMKYCTLLSNLKNMK